MIFLGKIRPLLSHQVLQKIPPQPAETLFGRCKRETRRVMIYRNGEARERDREAHEVHVHTHAQGHVPRSAGHT